MGELHPQLKVMRTAVGYRLSSAVFAEQGAMRCEGTEQEAMQHSN